MNAKEDRQCHRHPRPDAGTVDSVLAGVSPPVPSARLFAILAHRRLISVILCFGS